MDISFLNGFQVPVVIGICLIVGYILKQWVSKLSNKLIPTILTVLGAILACVYSQDITLEVILSGMFSGLVSIGLHQNLKQLLSFGEDGDE